MSESLSKAHASNRASPHVDGHDDARFFGHAASRDSHRAAERTREERQGTGPCTSMFDKRFYSNSAPDDIKPTRDGPIHRDSGGFPIYSQEISAPVHETADRIRRRER